MPVTIQYSSRRGEVWTQYWRLWRQKLWRFHAALFTAIALGLLVGLSDWHLSPTALAGVAVVGGLLPCAGFALYPLAKFKPQMRILTIDPAGLTTSIGKSTGDVPWHDVEAITDKQGLIVIRRTNGNAFVVPDRAFASPADRAEFLRSVQDGWAAVRP
jgi:hypothetical protein